MRVADYWPNSLLKDIRNEEEDDHDRERAVRPLYQVSTHPWVHQSWKTVL